MAPLLYATSFKALQRLSRREEKKVEQGGLGTASIVGIVIFAVFALGAIALTTAYCIHQRKERKKLPKENRPVSYHPFRTNSAKQSLLGDAADPSDDDKVMFSRKRGSSVSLYVDADVYDWRASMEPLVPLHISPAEELHDPMNGTSHGTGVSGSSSRYSRTTGGETLGVESEETDLGSRPTGRGRSRSSASIRYYERTATDPTIPIPTIVHTPSD